MQPLRLGVRVSVFPVSLTPLMWFPIATVSQHKTREQAVSPIKPASQVESLCKESPRYIGLDSCWPDSEIEASSRDAISCAPYHPSESICRCRRWNSEPPPRSIFLLSCDREFNFKASQSDESRTGEANAVKVEDGILSLSILSWLWNSVHWLTRHAEPFL